MRKFDRVVLVTRRTELEALVERHQTVGQARFVLERAGEDFTVLAKRHERYRQALQSVRAALPETLRSHVIEREALPTYRFEANDLVVTLGQDGLVANVAKYLEGQPLLPVNPDPEVYDGILLPVVWPDFAAVLKRTLAGTPQARALTMAEARLPDGQRLRAVNDLFIGAGSHVSARYRLRYGEIEEEQSSSGIIVSTGVGSTGWLRSIYRGAMMIAANVAGAKPPPEPEPMPWDAQELVFNVREPFPSQTTATNLVCGHVRAGRPLAVTSLMPRHGVIFSDGVEADRLVFDRGSEATIGVSDTSVTVITG